MGLWGFGWHLFDGRAVGTVHENTSRVIFLQRSLTPGEMLGQYTRDSQPACLLAHGRCWLQADVLKGAPESPLYP